MKHPRTTMIAIRLVLIGLESLATFAVTPDDLGKHTDQVKVLMAQPKVERAFTYVDKQRDEILREWTQITEINAPSGKEQRRAAYVERLLRSYKLQQFR